MDDLVLHPLTREHLDAFTARPSHAVLLVGLPGVGKGSISRALAAKLLATDPAKIPVHPYVTIVSPGEERSISIDAVRQLEHFMSLKTPGNQYRIAIIEDSHVLTPEAQNALLKTLEEPPANTTIIMTAATEHAILPTIRSRVQSIAVKRPAQEILEAQLLQEYDKSRVQQALQLGASLPGLTHALLTNSADDHPLSIAANMARDLLQKSTFERLALVDALSKKRDLANDTISMLQHMAHVALEKGSSRPKVWQNVLSASYYASESLRKNAQPKLVLTHLMLSL